LFAETDPVFILTTGKMREQTRDNRIRLHGRNKPSINSSRFRRRMERLLIALPKDGLIFYTPALYKYPPIREYFYQIANNVSFRG